MTLAVGLEIKRTSFWLRTIVLLYSVRSTPYIGKEGGQGQREKNLISWPCEVRFFVNMQLLLAYREAFIPSQMKVQ